ncbi:MAG: hypothetical protein HKN91_06160 [Acidimicrobiia bacterium]|nr:hypothetical protein [Acidimicrobiia bacterium]
MTTLQKLLKGNGAFSATSGAALLFGAPWLNDSLGVHTWLLVVVGVGLLAYGIQIARLARPATAVVAAKTATMMDLGWVVVAVVLLVAVPQVMTTTGRVALALATAVVAALAAGQAATLRRLAG